MRACERRRPARMCQLAYDYLILATGATHSYFGHNEFEAFAPGLKSLADARRLETKSCRRSSWRRPKTIRAGTETS